MNYDKTTVLANEDLKSDRGKIFYGNLPHLY